MSDPILRGLIAATVLPMTDDFEIDESAFRDYLEWILDQGVHGLAVNVDTGEGPHLSLSEQVRVLLITSEVVAGRVPVISGLGPSSTARAVASATALRQAGADALLVFPSSAFRGVPLPPEIPADYYRRIGDGADVPLVLFQLQESLGGVEYPTDVLAALAHLPRVIAIKEATFDAKRFQDTVTTLRESDAEITLLTGNDNFIYESFLFGAEGALIGFGTLAVREQVAMIEAHEAGDRELSAALGARIQKLADVIFAPPIRDYRVRLKEALRQLGVIPGSAIRPPLPEVTGADRERIQDALAAFCA